MKNLIKKIGAVFLSLTVAASLLAGCGAKTTEPDASADKGTFRTLEVQRHHQHWRIFRQEPLRLCGRERRVPGL